MSFALGCNLVITVLMNGYICYLTFYFSHWGCLSAFINSVFTALAARDPESYSKTAIITYEVALAFNLAITPFFWIVIAPINFSRVGWTGRDLVCRIHWTITHSMPLIYCLLNYLVTRQITLFPEDWRIIFLLCLIYIYLNYLGTLSQGSPVYPGPCLDWKSAPSTIFGYTLWACFNSYLFYEFARWSHEV